MDEYQSADPQYGYNVNPIAGSNRGMKWGEETRAKVSAAGRGKPKSPEHRAKIAAALRGRKKPIEQVRKMAESRKGFRHTEESRRKISMSLQIRNAELRDLETGSEAGLRRVEELFPELK